MNHVLVPGIGNRFLSCNHECEGRKWKVANVIPTLCFLCCEVMATLGYTLSILLLACFSTILFSP